MIKLIVYQSRDEIIVTTPEHEHEAIRLYFTEGGRNLDEYDREESTDGFVSIGARVGIDY